MHYPTLPFHSEEPSQWRNNHLDSPAVQRLWRRRVQLLGHDWGNAFRQRHAHDLVVFGECRQKARKAATGA
jgi:hypothetical protein